ncbi:MAG: SDR family oxidoreductase [Thaumarchaeota archaeon]|nr:SDR family oxidoreductase [Nitrososphaerota archaeon]MCL5316746.1 SDR family oxidoreductase [Nitrososphaerota archaeon]
MTEPRTPLNGKICLVTGATNGIGEVAARELAKQGAKVIIVGRSQKRCLDTATRIKEATGNQQVEYLVADLSVQKEVRQLAEEFKSRYKRLDILINNAGAIFNKRQETADGLEMTFALNHMSYFLITNLLLDTIRASAPSRIINTSSAGHQGAKIDFDDLQGKKKYGLMRAYGQSKLANILFTYELARQLDGSGVSVNALHPGFVKSGFGKNMSGIVGFFTGIIYLFGISPEKGAKTIVYLATSNEVENITGKYFVKQKAVPSSKESYDRDAAKRLWDISAQLAGL